jgi:sugar-specific transcriptional regulator TrmB
VGAKAIIDSLTENYGSEAKEALVALERQEELSQVGNEEQDDSTASAWMVKGETGIRRRLAELVYSANSDIFCVGGYTHRNIPSS